MAHRTAAVAYRVLVTAPFGRDAAHIAKVLDDAGYLVQAFNTMATLAAHIDETSGVLVLSEEALLRGDNHLEQALRELPPWTDMPCVFFQSRRTGPAAQLSLPRLPPAIVNHIVLERPTSSAALVAAVAALMRARQKQFEVQSHVLALSQSHRELEHKVAERTAQLRAEMESRLAAEATLRQSQKMEVLGQLTGGVAHDFNNLLTPIVGVLDLLREAVRDNPRFDGFAVAGLQAAERAKLLVQRLLAFARRQHLQSRAVHIPELLAGLTDLMKRSLGPSISIATQIEDSLPAVQVDPNQLELALLNLAVNARDAMAGRGTVLLSVHRHQMLRRAPSGDGAYIAFAVRDDGCGMDEATLQKAIEPFFTTKEVGAGTGLGLSMVHGLAAQSGGELTIESTPGKGTTVTLVLPVAITEEQPLSTSGKAAGVRGRAAQTILLVDDEDLLRTITAEVLTATGYQVTQARSAEHALDILRSGLTPDIVVTDYAMEGMNGAALALKTAELFPALPVLLTTGYAAIDDERAQHLPRLAKPFRSAELVEAIESVVRDQAIGGR